MRALEWIERQREQAKGEDEFLRAPDQSVELEYEGQDARVALNGRAMKPVHLGVHDAEEHLVLLLKLMLLMLLMMVQLMMLLELNHEVVQH